MQYNLILLSLIKSLLGGRRTLPLTLPRSETHTDKGNNLCTRLGLVFAIGGSMVIALHARAAGPACSGGFCFMVKRWQIPHCICFSAVWPSLSILSSIPPPPSPPSIFSSCFFVVFLNTKGIHGERKRYWDSPHSLFCLVDRYFHFLFYLQLQGNT